MLNVLGIDPDTHTTAFAVVQFVERENDPGSLLAMAGCRTWVPRLRAVRVAAVKRQRGCTAAEVVSAMKAAGEKVVDELCDRYSIQLAVIEGQQINSYGRARPADILLLAQCAGALVAACHDKIPTAMLPKPADWKGQQPKEVNQGNTFRAMCIRFIRIDGKKGRKNGYCYPAGCLEAAKVNGYQMILRSHWKHLGDAAGLGLWGGRKYLAKP